MRAAKKKRHVVSVGIGALRPGEKLVPYASWDFASCECEPQAPHNGVPCVTAAQTGKSGNGAVATYRCLRCDATWSSDAGKREDR